MDLRPIVSRIAPTVTITDDDLHAFVVSERCKALLNFDSSEKASALSIAFSLYLLALKNNESENDTKEPFKIAHVSNVDLSKFVLSDAEKAAITHFDIGSITAENKDTLKNYSAVVVITPSYDFSWLSYCSSHATVIVGVFTVPLETTFVPIKRIDPETNTIVLDQGYETKLAQEKSTTK